MQVWIPDTKSGTRPGFPSKVISHTLFSLHSLTSRFEKSGSVSREQIKTCTDVRACCVRVWLNVSLLGFLVKKPEVLASPPFVPFGNEYTSVPRTVRPSTFQVLYSTHVSQLLMSPTSPQYSVRTQYERTHLQLFVPNGLSFENRDEICHCLTEYLLKLSMVVTLITTQFLSFIPKTRNFSLNFQTHVSTRPPRPTSQDYQNVAILPCYPVWSTSLSHPITA